MYKTTVSLSYKILYYKEESVTLTFNPRNALRQITSFAAETLCRNAYIFQVTVSEPRKPVLHFFNNFFLIQLNAHNMLNTYILITIYLFHVSVFVTSSSGRTLELLAHNYMICAQVTQLSP
jgi:hypothetical protein